MGEFLRCILRKVLLCSVIAPDTTFPGLETGDYLLVRYSGYHDTFQDHVHVEQLADIVVIRDRQNVSVVATISRNKFTLYDGNFIFHGIVENNFVHGAYAEKH